MERILNKGVNANSLKELNRRTLLRLLKKNDICSRADLAKKCGLKPATVTKIINNFIEIGLVKETGIMDGEKGRRSIGVRLNTEDFAVIGVRLTRTYVEIGRFDLRGELIKKKRIDFDFEKKPRLVLEQIVGETKRLIEQDKKRDVLAVGVAVPGPYFPDEGKMHKMTEFPGWDDICFNKEVVSAFNIPVIIDHDANAGALAEWWLSEDSFEKSTIYLAVGEGVGAGVVVNGDLFKGAYGTAGEIGHMSIDYNGMQCECGNKGCLTLYGSVFYLMRNIKKRIANGEKTVLTENFSMEEVVMAAKHRDKITCEEIS